MRIFITGATGFIGKHLITALQQDKTFQKTKLHLCVRNIERAKRHFPNCTLIEGDFSKDHQISDWLPRIESCDIVINAVGIITQTKTQTFEDLHIKAPIALFKACERANIKQVIQISALGADEGAQSPYHLSKKTADDFLQTLDLKPLILRPSIIYGDEAQSWQFFRALAALPLIGLLNKGQQKLRPIHIDDLTHAIATHIKQKPKIPSTKTLIDAVGGTEISFADLLKNMHSQTSDTAAWFIPIPSWIMIKVAGLASWLGATMINADALKMLQRGNSADLKPFISHFGFTPRALRFTALSPPQILQTRTYFLPLLLRLSIAAVWIWTAFTSAFLYPVQQSLSLLAQTGLTGHAALVALYGASFLDLLLGIAVLKRFKSRLITFAQLGLILGYTLILTMFIPTLWLDPFGPLLKNLPMMVAIITLQMMQPHKTA